MRHRVLTLLAGLSVLATADRGAAQPNAEAFVRRFSQFIDSMQSDASAPPAFALVVVQGDRTLFQRVHGPRDLTTGAPLTLNSPLYTASASKSFVGLLAAQLDARGVLPLTATFRDVWPNVTLPNGIDPGRVTARSTLAHVSGVEAPAVQWRYSETGDFRSSDVPALLPRFATRANRAYDYGNIGPVFYSAMAESRSGRSWRDLLQEHVVRPLGLTRTSARLEDFPLSEVAHCNSRQRGAWRPVEHKPTALLDAGGGIYSSAGDLGTYLRAFTSRGLSARGAISPDVLARTYSQVSVQDREFLGFRRDGYGLGWDLSAYEGHRIVSRSGGYPGCITFIAFEPTSGLGVVAFVLGDAGGAQFAVSLIQQAVDFWSGRPDAAQRAAARLTAYSTAAAAAVRRADAAPGVPENRLQHAHPRYVGRYRAEGFGDMSISLHPDGLEARAGVLRLLLVPQGDGRFNAHNAVVPARPWEVAFQTGSTGSIVSLTLDGVLFQRDGVGG